MTIPEIMTQLHEVIVQCEGAMGIKARYWELLRASDGSG
jgi:hypothetical protein